jgi:hypothetical protein
MNIPTVPDPHVLLVRFVTLGGAVVEVRGNAPAVDDVTAVTWICLGCDPLHHTWPADPAAVPYFGYTEWAPVCEAANNHAARCRAMPRPTAPAPVETADEVRDALDYVIVTSGHDTTRFRQARDLLFPAEAGQVAQ